MSQCKGKTCLDSLKVRRHDRWVQALTKCNTFRACLVDEVIKKLNETRSADVIQHGCNKGVEFIVSSAKFKQGISKSTVIASLAQSTPYVIGFCI